MKTTLILLSSLCFFSVIHTFESPQKTDLEILTYLKEVEWPKAYREQDVQLLDRILAEEFQMISNDGSWSTKAQELADIQKSKPTYDSFRFEIKRLEIFENQTAVIAGEGHIYASDKSGKKTYTTYQSSNILIKRRGLWKAINSHVSGVRREY